MVRLNNKKVRLCEEAFFADEAIQKKIPGLLRPAKSMRVSQRRAFCNGVRGFILLITLIISLSSSLILLFMLQFLTSTHTQLSTEKKEQAITRMIKQEITKLISSENISSACLLPIISISELKEKSRGWWKSHACELTNDARYYYEFLTDDPCAVTTLKDTTASYYRLTLKYHDAIWQTTFVKPKRIALSCQGVTHLVTLGMQMQRRF